MNGSKTGRRVPTTHDAALGWAHPGLAVTAADEIVTCHPATSEILFFDADGALKKSWSSGLVEAHGIAAVRDNGQDSLWITDNGAKADPHQDYDESGSQKRGRVVKLSTDGAVLATLPEPPLPVYRDGLYAPTSVAVFQESFGGNGDIWVADGYGSNIVHCFDRAGNYKSSLTGETGTAGAFSTPHALYISTRGAAPELYISDRRNDRIQVFDLDGNFKRAFGQDLMTRPGGFAPLGELLVIAELMARLTVLDENAEFVTYVGANTSVCEQPGWPNLLAADGTQVAPVFVPGKFNSPHAIASDVQGNLYITEWVIGGRTIKLAKV